MFSTNCLLTDMLGVRPLNAYTGRSAKNVLIAQARLGYYLGCNMYISSSDTLGNAKWNCDDDVGHKNFKWDWISIAYLIPYFTKIHDNAFYTGDSVKKCADDTMINAMIWTKGFLDSRDKKLTVVRDNSWDSRELDENFTVAALMAASVTEECGLKQTGHIIELGPISL